MPRARARYLATVCAAAALAPAAAVANPTAPQPSPELPAFSVGTTVTLAWQAAKFDANTVEQGYVITTTDLTAGGDVVRTAPATSRSLTVEGLIDGHAYRFGLQATERCGPPQCTMPGPPELSPVAEQQTTMDATAPTGSVLINGGDEFTRNRVVALALTADDPAAGLGLVPSGVGSLLTSQTGTFVCLTCDVLFGPMQTFELDEGADGPRTVSVRYMDGATDLTRSAPGNLSAVVADTITLDRVPPSVGLSLSTVSDSAGVHVTGTASAGDAVSGVVEASPVWTFGDGDAPQAGTTAAHTYTTPGVYEGTFSVADRAGNVTTRTFIVTIQAAPTIPDPGPSTSGTLVEADSTPLVTSGTVIVTPAPVVTTDPASTPTVTTSPTTTRRVVVNPALRVTARPRARRTMTVQVRAIRRGPVVATLTRTVKGRAQVVRRVRRIAGPGWVTFRFTAPVRGTYALRVTANGGSSYRLVRVAR